jgi:hypothetical protein
MRATAEQEIRVELIGHVVHVGHAYARMLDAEVHGVKR